MLGLHGVSFCCCFRLGSSPRPRSHRGPDQERTREFLELDHFPCYTPKLFMFFLQVVAIRIWSLANKCVFESGYLMPIYSSPSTGCFAAHLFTTIETGMQSQHHGILISVKIVMIKYKMLLGICRFCIHVSNWNEMVLTLVNNYHFFGAIFAKRCQA